MSTVEAAAEATQNVECLIHVRFNPDGTVAEIGERPQGVVAQTWFKFLSHNTLNRYQALAGGRGLFKLPRPDVDALKSACASEQSA
jgi:hypothetical protein